MYEDGSEQLNETEELPQRSATNWWLAAIVVLLVALLAAQLWPDNTVDPIAVADQTTTTTEAEPIEDEPADTTTTTTSPDETTTTTTIVEDTTTTTTTTTADEVPLSSSAAQNATTTWMTALASDDVDATWDLMSKESQERIGGRGSLEAQLPELMALYGGWLDAPDLISFTSALDSDGPDFALVVTVGGTRPAESEEAWEVVAIPVIMENGMAKVSPFLETDEMVGIAADTYVDDPVIFSGTHFTVIYPSAGSLLVYVNETFITDLRVETEDGGSYASFGPLGLEVGNHTVTAIYVDEDGSIFARAMTFVVGESS